MPLLLVIISFALLAIGTWLAPGFASADNVLQLLRLPSFLGLLAIGQTVVMLAGGIDLSMAWVLTASAVVYTGLCDGQDANVVPAVAAAIGVGLCTGLVNGLGIVNHADFAHRHDPGHEQYHAGRNIALHRRHAGRLQQPHGAGTGHQFGWRHPEHGDPVGCFRSAGDHRDPLYPWRAQASRGGENPRVSYLTGIANDRVIVTTYVISGVMASITGILFAAFSGASFLGMGDQFILPSIVAVVLGGTSMFGGRGGYGGTMAAVFFTTILTTVLVIENISTGVRSIVFGVAVLAAIIAQAVLARRENGRR